MPKKKAKSKKKAAGVLSKQEKELGWGGFDDKLAANKVGGTSRRAGLMILPNAC